MHSFTFSAYDPLILLLTNLLLNTVYEGVVCCLLWSSNRIQRNCQHLNSSWIDHYQPEAIWPSKQRTHKITLHTAFYFILSSNALTKPSNTNLYSTVQLNNNTFNKINRTHSVYYYLFQATMPVVT